MERSFAELINFDGNRTQLWSKLAPLYLYYYYMSSLGHLIAQPAIYIQIVSHSPSVHANLQTAAIRRTNSSPSFCASEPPVGPWFNKIVASNRGPKGALGGCEPVDSGTSEVQQDIEAGPLGTWQQYSVEGPLVSYWLWKRMEKAKGNMTWCWGRNYFFCILARIQNCGKHCGQAKLWLWLQGKFVLRLWTCCHYDYAHRWQQPYSPLRLCLTKLMDSNKSQNISSHQMIVTTVRHGSTTLTYHPTCLTHWNLDTYRHRCKQENRPDRLNPMW